MQVTDIDAQGLKHEFKVTIPAGQLEERLHSRLVEMSHTVKMPGFRPGKVPMKLLRQKYGQSLLGEILEAAVNDGAQKAVEGKGLRPALSPKIEVISFGEGKDLEFKVAVENMPEITPMDFATIKLERLKAEVPDAEIDTALSRIAEQHEGSEVVERTSESGDIVLIDFVGKQEGVAFQGGTAEGFKLKLGSGQFVPGFEEQLIGVKAGDAKVLDITFPDNYGNADLSGKAVTFDVTVHEVHKSIPAAVDDALAKQVGLESLDKLRDIIRDQMTQDLTQLARSKVKRALLDVLAENHSFEVPQSLADHEFDGIWKQIEGDREAGQLDPEDAGKSEDDLKAEYRALAERRVRLGLLLSEVGRSNNVNVSQEDLNKGLMAEARRYPGQEHFVFQYYRENPQALDQIRAPIFEDKVIDFILELAKVEDRVVSADELRALPEEGGDGAEKPAAEAKPKKKATKKKAADSEGA